MQSGKVPLAKGCGSLRDGVAQDVHALLMNDIPPFDSHRPIDTLLEISAILAAGLQRLFDRKSSQNSHCVEETPLDCRAPSERHVRQKSKDITP